MSQPTPTFTLSASYTSPTSHPFTITKPLSAPSPPSSSSSSAAAAQDKSRYLHSLRAAVDATQDRINKELTARMEQDKAREAAAGGEKPSLVDEDKEEENYGEEVQEEED